MVILILSLLLMNPCLEGADFPFLFDGEDLDGWTVKNGTAPFTVEHGRIDGTCVSGSLDRVLGTNPKRILYEKKAEKLRSQLLCYPDKHTYPLVDAIEKRVCIRDELKYNSA